MKSIVHPKLNFEEYLVGIDIDIDEGRNKYFFDKIHNKLDDAYSDIYSLGKGIRLFSLSYEKNYEYLTLMILLLSL